MADEKISQQTEKFALANNDEFIIVDSVTGLNRKIKANNAFILNGFEVDGFSFLTENIAIVDGDSGNDTGATVGGQSFKTIEAAALAVKTAYDLNTNDTYLVYIMAFNGAYLPVSVAGAITYPEIHYYCESKCIIRSVGSGNTPFGDFTNGEGNYFFHGKGEWYSAAASIFSNTFAFTESSNVFISASVLQGIGILEDNTINPEPRAKMELHIDTLLTTGNIQSNQAKDLRGGNIKFHGTDFIGGMAWGFFWQRRVKIDFDRCKFRLSPAVHNPTDGEYEVFDKAGNSLFTIDMTDTDQSRQSRLADFSTFANVQANVDSDIIVDSRASCVEIRLDNDAFELEFTWTDCEFYIDQDKGIGFKIVIDTGLDAGKSVFKLIRPRFIDTSGGTTTAITAWKTGSQIDPKFFVENAVSNADTFNTSHTSNTDIVILDPLAEIIGAGVIKTLSSGVVAAGTDRHLIIAAESGTADDLIEITGLSIGEDVLVRADAGDTITLKHNDAGATIKLLITADADLVLDEDNPLRLTQVDALILAQNI